MLRHGLSVLSAAFKITDYDALVELVRQNISLVRGDYKSGRYNGRIDAGVQSHHQDMRRKLWYSEHDAAQDRGEKTPFDSNTPDMPPLAGDLLEGRGRQILWPLCS